MKIVESALASLEIAGLALVELGPREADALAATVLTAQSFFRLSPTDKAKSTLGPVTGFRPYGIEYSNSPERPDEMETFSTNAAAAARRMEFAAGPTRELHDRASEVFRLLEPLAEELVIGLAARFNGRSTSDVLRGGLRSWSTLQINHSRPSKAESAFINEVHEDGHFLSMVYATSEGLEVRDFNGAFNGVTPGPTHVAVMLGGVASLMTDGRLPPLYHRVCAVPTITERTSILFFADLDPELCKPWITGDTNRSVDIGAFIRENPVRFGLQKYGAD